MDIHILYFVTPDIVSAVVASMSRQQKRASALLTFVD